jgi:heat shock protein HtpX
VSGTSLFEQQRQNRRRSAILVAVFVLFFAWIGFGADGVLYLQSAGTEPGQYRHVFPFIGIAATLLALGMTGYAWKSGAKQVLSATGAWELITPSTDEERQLVNVVEEMAIASGLPKPKVWIVPDDDPNAFATGSDPKTAHVAVTRGLLTSLSRDELQGVVAHEMAHVRNLDVRLMTLLAALVGVIAIISDITIRGMRFGGGRGRSGGGGGGGKKGGGGGALVLVLLAVWLITVILAPVISRMLALAVSRKREYLADATGAQFTRNPAALASALEKIEHAAAPTRAIKHGTAHLCISDPLGRRVTSKQGFVADLLATHPPMATRIARLKRMAYVYEKTGELVEPAL